MELKFILSVNGQDIILSKDESLELYNELKIIYGDTHPYTGIRGQFEPKEPNGRVITETPAFTTSSK